VVAKSQRAQPLLSSALSRLCDSDVSLPDVAGGHLLAYRPAGANGYAPGAFASVIWNRGSRFSDKIVFHRRSIGSSIASIRSDRRSQSWYSNPAALDRRRDEVEL
jgi:hypothetical protein